MNSDLSDQIFKEIKAVIRRYTIEGDLKMGEIIAALELAKAEVIEQWHAKHRAKHES